MMGFFQEDENSYSMSRLGMFLGINGGIAYTLINKSPDWKVVAALMIGGCLPYIFNKINELKNLSFENPKVLESITNALSKLKKGA